MNKPIISAVVCTYNRKDYLKKTIESLVEQDIKNVKYEIVIVDNNSNDGTYELVKGYMSTFSNLRYVHEEKQGLSYARNTGISKARGEYIAFIDDDQIASCEWLKRILRVFREIDHPKIAVIGGKVLPIWESQRPDWLTDCLAQFYSITRYPDIAFVLKENQYILGGNAAYKMSIMEKVGGYDTELGSREGDSLISGEDVIIHRNIQKLGYEIYYDPTVIVYHNIPKERLTKKWVIRRSFWGGYSSYYCFSTTLKNNDTKMTGIILNSSYNLLFNMLLAMAAFVIRRNYNYMSYLTRAIHHLGYLYGLLQIHNIK